MNGQKRKRKEQEISESRNLKYRWKAQRMIDSRPQKAVSHRNVKSLVASAMYTDYQGKVDMCSQESPHCHQLYLA